MAGRQESEGTGGPSKFTKQILGLATGAALGLLAFYGASKTLRYLEVSHIRLLELMRRCCLHSNHCKRASVSPGKLPLPPSTENIFMQRSGSSKKPKEIGMSAPPGHKGKDSSSAPQSHPAATKESEPERATTGQPHDDKDGKVKDGKGKGAHAAELSHASENKHHGGKHDKEKNEDSHAEETSHATLSTIVQEEKVPEPGFDAPEDKMQGIVSQPRYPEAISRS